MAPGGDPITTYVYTPNLGGSATPAGLVWSTSDPDGDVTAYSYDTAGNATATYQGQTVAMVSGSAAFLNLPQSPGQARTYAVYVQSSVAPASATGYTVTESGTATPGLSFTGASSTPLGSGWYELGTVKLAAADVSSGLTVSYSGTATVSAVTLLQQTASTVYDSQENAISQTDALGNVTASTYDNLGRPLAASQGQAVVVASGAPATFANLPSADGQARTYAVYVQSSVAPTGYSVTQNGTGSISWTTTISGATPLGSGWYEMGVVTLAAGNTSSGLTVSYTDAGTVSQVACLEQTSATVYDAASNVLSQTDGLDNVTTYGYNELEQQTSTSQGQIVPVSSGSATINNLPQTPGLGRTYAVYVQEASFDGSYTVDDNLNGSPTWTPAPAGSTTPLGSGWSAAGTIALCGGDHSSTLTFPGSLGSATEICLVTQVSGETYTPTGLLCNETDADGGVTTYGYDAVGDELSETDPAAQAGSPTTNYVFDADWGSDRRDRSPGAYDRLHLSARHDDVDPGPDNGHDVARPATSAPDPTSTTTAQPGPSATSRPTATPRMTCLSRRRPRRSPTTRSATVRLLRGMACLPRRWAVAGHC